MHHLLTGISAAERRKEAAQTVLEELHQLVERHNPAVEAVHLQSHSAAVGSLVGCPSSVVDLQVDLQVGLLAAVGNPAADRQLAVGNHLEAAGTRPVAVGIHPVAVGRILVVAAGHILVVG